MAYLTGTERVYLFVEEEENPVSAAASEHSVEQGENLTDHLRKESEELTLNGVISGSRYRTIVSLIKNWQGSGQAVRYAGKSTLTNCAIIDFSTGFSKAIKNGCTFSMTLRKVRTAKPAYTVPAEGTQVNADLKAVSNAGLQSVEQNNPEDCYHSVKSGDTVWALVNGPYKKYGKSCEEIMAMNPDAFSRPGDFTTLKVGARLNMGGGPDWSSI